MQKKDPGFLRGPVLLTNHRGLSSRIRTILEKQNTRQNIEKKKPLYAKG